MPYLYILKSLNYKKTYVGSTDRTLEIRLSEHNSKKHFYTKRYAPWKLIYFEEYNNLQDARLREKFFKSASGRRQMKNIIRE